MVYSEEGTPIEYTVAAGDVGGAICQRFGIGWWQLENDDGEEIGTYPDLFVGDVLSITTSASPRSDPLDSTVSC